MAGGTSTSIHMVHGEAASGQAEGMSAALHSLYGLTVSRGSEWYGHQRRDDQAGRVRSLYRHGLVIFRQC